MNPKTSVDTGCRDFRIDIILNAVIDMVEEFPPDLVMIEDYAHSRRTAQSTLGEVGGVVRRGLWLRDIPYSMINSRTLKKFATGNGNASKGDMVAAVQQYYTTRSDDIADAIFLAQYAHDFYDDIVEEIVA